MRLDVRAREAPTWSVAARTQFGGWPAGPELGRAGRGR